LTISFPDVEDADDSEDAFAIAASNADRIAHTRTELVREAGADDDFIPAEPILALDEVRRNVDDAAQAGGICADHLHRLLGGAPVRERGAAYFRADRNHAVGRLDAANRSLPLIEGPPPRLGRFNPTCKRDARERAWRRFFGSDGDVRLATEGLLEQVDLKAFDDRRDEHECGNSNRDAGEDE
jgi:hypothetical protein